MSAPSQRRKSAKRKGVSREELLRRRAQRSPGVVVHGVCRGGCERRTYLILPARYCMKCLEAQMDLAVPEDGYVAPTAEEQMLAMNELWGEEDDDGS